MNILVTGARAPIAADLAKALALGGHQVWLADSLRHPVGVSSPWIRGVVRLPAPRQDFRGFEKRLVDTCRELALGAIVPSSEEVFWLARAAVSLPAGVDLRTSPLRTLAVLHHKGLFAQLATRLGYGAAENIELKSRADLALLHEAKRFVLKPVYSRFASRVLLSPTPEQLAMLRPSPENPWLAQTRVSGRELCSYNVAQEGRLLLHVAYEPRFRAGIGASLYFSPVADERLREMSARLIEATGFTGQISFDAIETEAGLVAIECNPRGTSGVHLAVQEPVTLAAALLGQATPAATEFMPSPRMLMLPLLLHHPGLLFSASGRGALHAARDALAVSGISLAGQLRALLEIKGVASRLGTDIATASTHDFEWNGEVDHE